MKLKFLVLIIETLIWLISYRIFAGKFCFRAKHFPSGIERNFYIILANLVVITINLIIKIVGRIIIGAV